MPLNTVFLSNPRSLRDMPSDQPLHISLPKRVARRPLHVRRDSGNETNAWTPLLPKAPSMLGLEENGLLMWPVPPLPPRHWTIASARDAQTWTNAPS